MVWCLVRRTKDLEPEVHPGLVAPGLTDAPTNRPIDADTGSSHSVRIGARRTLLEAVHIARQRVERRSEDVLKLLRQRSAAPDGHRGEQNQCHQSYTTGYRPAPTASALRHRQGDGSSHRARARASQTGMGGEVEESSTCGIKKNGKESLLLRKRRQEQK